VYGEAVSCDGVAANESVRPKGVTGKLQGQIRRGDQKTSVGQKDVSPTVKKQGLGVGKTPSKGRKTGAKRGRGVGDSLRKWGKERRFWVERKKGGGGASGRGKVNPETTHHWN